MTAFDDLPMPSPAAAQRSESLSEHIRQVIAQHHGFIPFSTFMALALYHPKLGYYQSDTFDIGRSGDFITAPAISPLFGACLAHQCAQLFEALNCRNVLEIGAGTGKLASDLLQTFDQMNQLPDHYYIVEISHSLRQKQAEFLKTHCPQLAAKVAWLDTPPANFNGIIIANEVLDALPVNCFHIDTEITERGVSWDGQQFIWQLKTPISPGLTIAAESIRREYQLPHGYTAELPAELPAFIQSLANCLSQGAILLADYGYGRAEYYHPERRQGTLTCFYQHRKHPNPLIMPGLQDITAHVDFTAVAECAVDHGLAVAGYTTQAAFLLGCGLLTLAASAEQSLSPADAFTLHQQIKTLTMPTEMGELIKIMCLTKNIDLPDLMGFALQDRRRAL